MAVGLQVASRCIPAFSESPQPRLPSAQPCGSINYPIYRYHNHLLDILLDEHRPSVGAQGSNAVLTTLLLLVSLRAANGRPIAPPLANQGTKRAG